MKTKNEPKARWSSCNLERLAMKRFFKSASENEKTESSKRWKKTRNSILIIALCLAGA